MSSCRRLRLSIFNCSPKNVGLSGAEKGYATLLYDKGFDFVRNYIMQKDSDYKGGELVTFDDSRIIFNGGKKPLGAKCHLVKFWSEELENSLCPVPPSPIFELSL